MTSSIIDYGRRKRIGLPESIFCAGKSPEAIDRIIAKLKLRKREPFLFTRLSREKLAALKHGGLLEYDPVSQTAFLNGTWPKLRTLSVAIVSAGTSDASVAHEAHRTLEHLGLEGKLFSDVGVAGLWRLQKRLPHINRCDVGIVVAGMDAALASVLGGLTPKPLIAVPTSVGYGVAHGGVSAMQSMLSSCAPGVTVVNIDNGYGAACAAYRMLGLTRKTR